MTMLNTFGGHALDRYVFDFEATGDGGADTSGDYDTVVAEAGAEGGAVSSPAATEPAEETGAAAAEAPSSVEEATPPWAPDRESYEEMTALTQAVAQILTQPGQEAETAEPSFEFDPLDPNAGQTIQEFVRAEIQRGVQAQLADITPVIEKARFTEASEIKDGLLDSFGGQIDGFEKDNPAFRAGAEYAAAAMLDQVKAELGLDPSQPSRRAAEVALKRGAEWVAAFVKPQRDAGKAAYIAELQTLKEAPGTLGVTGGGIEGIEPADDYDEALKRIFARA